MSRVAKRGPRTGALSMHSWRFLLMHGKAKLAPDGLSIRLFSLEQTALGERETSARRVSVGWAGPGLIPGEAQHLRFETETVKFVGLRCAQHQPTKAFRFRLWLQAVETAH